MANTQANGDAYKFIPTVVNGTLRYIPTTATTALNGQNDGGKLICMGTNVVGGPSGNAWNALHGSGTSKIVIGDNACASWNATTTSNLDIVIGQAAIQNTQAAQTIDDLVALGRECGRGLLGTSASLTDNVLIGTAVCRDYQPGSRNVYIGKQVCISKPSSANDALSVKIGYNVMGQATQVGGQGLVLIGHSIMNTASCTFGEQNSSIMIGREVCSAASGQLSFDNVFIGRMLPTAVFGASGVTQNAIVAPASLTGTAASLAARNVVCVGGGSLVGAGAGLGTDDVVIGGRTFVANVAPLATNLVCLGAAQTGVPAQAEVMIGKGCAASTVAGRLSFGNAMEAVAGAANVGAAVLPATPQAFMPLNYNGVAYKIPLYLP